MSPPLELPFHLPFLFTPLPFIFALQWNACYLNVGLSVSIFSFSIYLSALLSWGSPLTLISYLLQLNF